MSDFTHILKSAITNVKYCQHAILSTSDGLLIEAFPDTDKDFNDALSAATSSIYGITSTVSMRAGKQQSDYVLIKNPDSFLLVYFIGKVSLMLIADSRVNLGMLLHVGRKLRNNIVKLNIEPSIESGEQINEEIEQSEDSMVHRVISEDVETEDETAYDEIEVEDVLISTEQDTTPDSLQSKDMDTETTEIPSITTHQQTEESLTENDYAPTEEKHVQKDENGGFRFSDEDKSVDEQPVESDETSSVSISFNDENQDNNDDQSDTTQISEDKNNLTETNEIPDQPIEDESDDEEYNDSYQSFASWREKIQKENDDEEDSSEDGLL